MHRYVKLHSYIPGPVVNGTSQICFIILEPSINFSDKVLLNEVILSALFLKHQSLNRGG